MEKYDVPCPLCGTLNKGLYLDETNGWMVCEKCDQAVRVLRYGSRRRKKAKQLPIYTCEQLAILAKQMAI